MKTRYQQSGFTLIEILVAAAIILSILSMVYGTYFAISKSTQATRAKLILSQQTLKVLTQLTRQIRGSYADAVSDSAYTTKPVSERKEEKTQNNPDFFSGYTDNPSEEILHLITTNRFDMPQNSPAGLFDVTYRFDKSKGQLYLSQKRFIGTTKNTAKKKLWQLIAENIQSLELAFFDGQQWLNKWTFKDRKKLPNAVKIDITFRDQTDRIYGCSTVAYIYCRTDYGRETQLSKLVVTKNK